MKKLFTFVLTALLLFGVQSAWAGEGIVHCEFWYSLDGGISDSKIMCYPGDNNKDALDLTSQTISSLIITRYYEKVWYADGGNISGGELGYMIGLHNGTEYKFGSAVTVGDSYISGAGGNDHTRGNASVNATIVSSTTPSGKYCLAYWFHAWYGDQETNYYCNNSSHNYGVLYNVLPPAVSSFTVTPTGVIGGTGTESDPYIVKYGSSITLTASGSQAHTDANSEFYAKFGSADPSKTTLYTTIENVTNSDAANIVVEGSYKNKVDASLSGAASSKTIYYKAGNKYDLAVGSALYATLFLPYAAEIPADINAYYESNYEASGSVVTATFSEVTTTIPANTPVIIKATTAGTYPFKEVAGVDPVTRPLTPHFEGSTSVTTKESIVNAGRIPYVLANGTSGLGFYLLNNDQSVAANKCYYWTSVQAMAPSIRMRIEGDATAIPFIGEANEDVNAPIYTILGQRVQNMSAPGIYIQNGQKFIVK